jgi:hypothetical protein
MDYETTPEPASNPPRRTEERIPDIKADPHQMPKFINRHETAADVQRRGHLLPSEWDHKFDPRTNQPISIPREGRERDPNFESNLLKPTKPSLGSDHPDSQSTS